MQRPQAHEEIVAFYANALLNTLNARDEDLLFGNEAEQARAANRQIERLRREHERAEDDRERMAFAGRPLASGHEK